MTIKIFSYRITIFKIEKLERANLNFDQNQARKQAEEIKNSDSFKALQEQARRIRENRK